MPTERTAVDWDGIIEQQGDALTRILVALAAMAGLLAPSRHGFTAS